MANFYGRKPLIYMPRKTTITNGGSTPSPLHLCSHGYVTSANKPSGWAQNAFLEADVPAGEADLTNAKILCRFPIGYSNNNYKFNIVRGKMYYYDPLPIYNNGYPHKNLPDFTFIYFIIRSTGVCYKITKTTASRVYPTLWNYTSAHDNILRTTPMYSDLGTEEGQIPAYGFPYNQNNSCTSQIDTALVNAGVTDDGDMILANYEVDDSTLQTRFGATSFVNVTY